MTPEQPPLAERPVDELRKLAAELNITNPSKLGKGELIAAIELSREAARGPAPVEEPPAPEPWKVDRKTGLEVETGRPPLAQVAEQAQALETATSEED